jgi:hypothetical protein
MAASGGGGGCDQGPPPPPTHRLFAKVATRYAPLVLLVPLHGLSKKYMKNIPKFIREGDLTTFEHINLFDQFVDILGLEHEDVYSQFFFQTFKEQVRTCVGIGVDPGFNAQEHTNKALTTGPFSNTCEENAVSLKVEVGVVARLRCMQL